MQQQINRELPNHHQNYLIKKVGTTICILYHLIQANTINTIQIQCNPTISPYCQTIPITVHSKYQSIINKKACLYLFLIIQANTINTINTIQMQCNSTRSRRIAKQYNYCFILQNIKSIINKKHVLPTKTKTNYQVNQVSSRSNNIERRVISSYLWEGIVSKVSLGRRCCLCE